MTLPQLTRDEAWKLRLATFEAVARSYARFVLLNDIVGTLFISDVQALVRGSLGLLEGGLVSIPAVDTPGIRHGTFGGGVYSPQGMASDIVRNVEDFLNQVIEAKKDLMTRAIRGVHTGKVAFPDSLIGDLTPLVERRDIPGIMARVKAALNQQTARYALFLPRPLLLLGRGLLVFGVAVSLYHVVTAENWKLALGRELTGFGFGMAGAAAGGIAGSAAGPFAPLAIPLGAFVGGFIGAIVGQSAFDYASKSLACHLGAF